MLHQQAATSWSHISETELISFQIFSPLESCALVKSGAQGVVIHQQHYLLQHCTRNIKTEKQLWEKMSGGVYQTQF